MTAKDYGKFGVVGTGKTGAVVKELLGGQAVACFTRSHRLTFEKVQGLDALIVFVPADGLTELLPLLLECRKPVVCGTTGFQYPSDFDAELKKTGMKWITASNFSPGMNFMFTVAKLLEANREFLGAPLMKIHEIHHVHKIDSPSGTAVSLQKMTGGQTEIRAERVGDHPGFHEITGETGDEKLVLQHHAKNRRAFAEGAIYAARVLIPDLPVGLHHFETLMTKKILANGEK